MAELAVQKYVRSARVVVIASTGDWAPAGAKAGYDWLRCNASGAGCRPISGSCDRRYTVRGPDVGYTLRVRLTVTEPGQLPASDVSGPTAVIVEDVYAESTVDSGGTCVNVTSTRPGQGTFTSSSPTGPGTTPAPDTDLSFSDPFPVVRISGRFTRRRTKLNARHDQRPPRRPHPAELWGTRLPLPPQGHRREGGPVVRVRALQRSCRPRATIEIRVTQPKRIGKYTLVKTRRGKAPLRVDRRLMSGSTRPVRCPAG